MPNAKCWIWNTVPMRDDYIVKSWNRKVENTTGISLPIFCKHLMTRSVRLASWNKLTVDNKFTILWYRFEISRIVYVSIEKECQRAFQASLVYINNIMRNRCNRLLKYVVYLCSLSSFHGDFAISMGVSVWDPLVYHSNAISPYWVTQKLH